jgi:hypothetical protein
MDAAIYVISTSRLATSMPSRGRPPHHHRRQHCAVGNLSLRHQKAYQIGAAE